ncbi:MAG: 2-oxoglutarate dehydrogenase complex dihydrolipoyllysine-residue succinyltransferase [Bauldia litoralis]
MPTEIKVPTLGESVTEATVARWFKAVGEAVEEDEPLVELETDKVTLEVPSPVAGVLTDIQADEGAEVEVGALLGSVDENGEAKPSKGNGKAKAADAKKETAGEDKEPAKAETSEGSEKKEEKEESKSSSASLSPAVRKLVDEHDLDPDAIEGSGKDGRLTKGDVLAYLDDQGGAAAVEQAPAKQVADRKEAGREERAPAKAKAPAAPREPGEREERVRMSRLRQRIAERLKEAQDTAAILTTFNDVDMSAVMEFRSRYKDSFEKKHGVRLGFMSFFVKACIAALKEVPSVNAEFDGDAIIYKNHYDIGVAVGTDQGLVVPVVRDADAMSFAEVEQAINELGVKARDGKLSMDDLTGGTFTISNGGVYGSMLSTPILNPPQSGILGMHRIEQRPVVRDGQIVARPMMYLALSYDHRIIDGREAVTFLVRVKENIEDPERLLLGV